MAGIAGRAASGPLSRYSKRRVTWAVALGAILAVVAPRTVLGDPSGSSEISEQEQVSLFVDSDDDDGDGVADGSSQKLGGKSSSDLFWLRDLGRYGALEAVEGSVVRLFTDRRTLKPTDLAGSRRAREVGLQGLAPGSAVLAFEKGKIIARVFSVTALGANGEPVDQAASHASIGRVLPVELRATDAPPDQDALRWRVMGPAGLLPMQARLLSVDPEGRELDELREVALFPVECPVGTSATLECRQSPEIRATTDVVDRSHPASSDRSLLAEVGGRISFMVDGKKAASIGVGGARESRLGPMLRLRGKLRIHLVRISSGAAASIGGSDVEARARAREEVRVASSLWGQCGIHFEHGPALSVDVVDPPPPRLLAIGCDLGLPASGGELRFRVGAHRFRVETHAGESPAGVAGRVAGALEKGGLRATALGNPRADLGALATADVALPAGGRAVFSRDQEYPLSTDPTLRACLGEVDLGDGLEHFTDFDAAAGTLEERSLIRAYDDGDPRTIEVFVVPSFSDVGRIGESFIFGGQGNLGNAIILDRAAVLAGTRSYAFAHELGHILLDMPGHPDDFGVDDSTLLMDADAADSTIFGPRRLTLPECERAVLESGPGSSAPLLEEWPRRPAASRN